MKPISNRFAIALILVAALFDGLSFVPILSEATAAVGQVVLGCLFFLAGTNVFKNKPAVLYTLATILELVPVSSPLPMFLIETAAIIALSRRKQA